MPTAISQRQTVTQGLTPVPAQSAGAKREVLQSLALASQGFADRDAFAVGRDSAADVISRLGFLQIDTISVVARAHHHTLWNRIADYDTHLLDSAIADRTIFEYWAHAAAYLPMRDYRFAQVRMNDMRDGKSRWVRSTDTRLMRSVLKRIQTEGPLRSRDFEAKSRASKGWWDWKPTKHALEQLFMQGDLMISGREGFQKLYDLRERVLPAGVDTRFPTTLEYAQYLIDTQLRSYGASTEPSFTYLLPGRDLRAAVGEVLAERLRNGSLERLEIDGVSWFIDNNRLATHLAGPKSNPISPATSERACLLSPFDNLIIQRDRLRALFGFDYVLECYVPEPKRKFGYFSLPVLMGNRFIGRADCKAHRKTRVFEIKQLFWEPDVDPGQVIVAVAQELLSFAHFNGCRKVQFDPRNRRGEHRESVEALADSIARQSATLHNG